MIFSLPLQVTEMRKKQWEIIFGSSKSLSLMLVKIIYHLKASFYCCFFFSSSPTFWGKELSMDLEFEIISKSRFTLFINYYYFLYNNISLLYLFPNKSIISKVCDNYLLTKPTIKKVNNQIQKNALSLFDFFKKKIGTNNLFWNTFNFMIFKLIKIIQHKSELYCEEGDHDYKDLICKSFYNKTILNDKYIFDYFWRYNFVI
ncbi:hypothetical protein RFI_33180 [Reticulomyxa filosa]|uniref:Uncharacterized protein n=1 Tax=Reticulomyxa filosa TaxID=46433 RepID=X6LSX5_RETFI|nr:hypothetical protein RFI_33180 [Reticulomyxa filosa]|eukprot:ETO04217.1 hypothetical protein RFI_33180 [Reticulomyxa filosa]